MAGIHYCKSWFSAKKRPTQVWDEAKARRAHEDRNPYTGLIGALERPTHIVDVIDKFVGVDFLDGHLREALSYHFKEYEPGKLFLSMAVYREFDGESDRVTCGDLYFFDRSGAVTIKHEAFDPHSLEVAESVTDVSGNYDFYPDFGVYDRVCRRERMPSGGGRH